MIVLLKQVFPLKWLDIILLAHQRAQQVRLVEALVLVVILLLTQKAKWLIRPILKNLLNVVLIRLIRLVVGLVVAELLGPVEDRQVVALL